MPNQVKISPGSVNVWGVDILCLVGLFIVFFRSRSNYRAVWADVLLALPGLWYGVGLSFGHNEKIADVIQSTIRSTGPWLFPYLIARIGVGSWHGVKEIYRIIVLLAAIFSILAFVEALAGFNILVRAGITFPPSREREKFGLNRPFVTFNSLHILGMFLATTLVYSLGVLLAGIRPKSGWSVLALVCAVGTFCSTSATGIMQAVLGTLVLIFYPLRRFWLVPLLCLTAWTGFVHVISNRSVFHWYASHIGGLGDAYYRADLMVYLPRAMPGHWLFGFGYQPVTPMWYASYEDICNQWLFLLAKGGLPCLLFMVVFVCYMYYRLRMCYKLVSNYKGERIFVWSLMSIQISLTFAFFFIALYGSDIAIFSFLFGLIVSLPQLAEKAIMERLTCPQREGQLKC